MSQSQAYRQAIQAISGLNNFSMFINKPEDGYLEFEAKCNQTIAGLLGWSGVFRLNNDIGVNTPSGYIAHAVCSQVDDVFCQVNN